MSEGVSTNQRYIEQVRGRADANRHKLSMFKVGGLDRNLLGKAEGKSTHLVNYQSYLSTVHLHRPYYTNSNSNSHLATIISRYFLT